ncbi:hypothetical protein AcidC75_18350 [Acidisoma sp. C75]
MAEWAEEWGIAKEERNSSGSFDRAYLAAAIKAGRAGTGVFGIRLQYEYLSLLSKTLDQIYPGRNTDAERFRQAFGEPLYIHLSRSDKVAQAVSLVRAEQSGLWHLNDDGTDYERFGKAQDPSYDFNRLHREVLELTRGDQAWSQWFASQQIKPYCVSYGQLSECPNDTLQGICRAIGISLEGISNIKPRLAKLSDVINDEWIRRYNSDAGRVAYPLK